LKRARLVALAAIIVGLSAIAFLFLNGYITLNWDLGPHATPIRTITSDPASFDGKNVTVSGVIGSRETTTGLRSSLTIMDSEGHYIDLLKPVPFWLIYEIGNPFIITGTFAHYEYGSNSSYELPQEEGYGLYIITLEKVFNTMH